MVSVKASPDAASGRRAVHRSQYHDAPRKATASAPPRGKCLAQGMTDGDEYTIEESKPRTDWEQPMPQVVESENQLEFSERMSPVARVIVFIVGCVPLLAPYELLYKPHWHGHGWFMVIPIVIATGATLLALAFMAAAFLGMNQSLCFDARTRTVIYQYETAITSLRRRDYDFAEVAEVDLKVHTWDSGPDTYGVQVKFADGRKAEVGSYGKAEADRYLQRVQDMLRTVES